MNNETFIIKPSDWRFRAWPAAWFWQSRPDRIYWVYESSFGWVWEINAGHGTLVESKEAAMAACEQHWRAEIEPALVRAEDGRDTLLGRALEALQTVARYPVARGYVDSPCLDREDMKEVEGAIAEIEKALPAGAL